MTHRFLILSASMGAGHDAVAGELARRLRSQGHHVTMRDVLGLLPPGIGPALRGAYRTTIRRLPWMYGAIYPLFFDDGRGPRPGSAPLATLAERRLTRVVEDLRPDVVVPAFHLAAQLTGGLRARGVLRVPAVVVVTDFAVHRQWLHPGNDLQLCVSEAAAARARAATGRPAAAPGPVVPPHFAAAARESGFARDSVAALEPAARGSGAARANGSPWARLLDRHAPGRPAVLLSAGAWGAGSSFEETARLLLRSGCLPVLLCGRDEVLLRRTGRVPGALALGWVEDLAGLMAAARVLVDNAAGQTAVQALAAGLPVVGYRPIPGHGRDGVREMAAAGLSEVAGSGEELVRAVRRLASPGAFRDRRVATARVVFAADTAELISAAAAGRTEGRAPTARS